MFVGLFTKRSVGAVTRVKNIIKAFDIKNVKNRQDTLLNSRDTDTQIQIHRYRYTDTDL